MSKAYDYAVTNKLLRKRPGDKLAVKMDKVHPSALSSFMRDLSDTLSQGVHDVPTWAEDTDFATGASQLVEGETLKGFTAVRETVKRTGVLITGTKTYAGGTKSQWRNLFYFDFPKGEQVEEIDTLQKLGVK